MITKLTIRCRYVLDKESLSGGVCPGQRAGEVTRTPNLLFLCRSYQSVSTGSANEEGPLGGGAGHRLGNWE
jgi:hypothetical protein